MKKVITFLLVVVCLFSLFAVSVSAQEYADTYPSYAGVSGGAWVEVRTDLGRFTLVLPIEYKQDYLSFDKSTGYNLVSVSNSTVSGRAYFQDTVNMANITFRDTQVRFSSFGTLQIYVPYRTGNNTLSWRYEEYDVDEIYATNCDFIDEAGNRGNDLYTYDWNLISVVLLGFIALFLLLGLVLRPRMLRM